MLFLGLKNVLNQNAICRLFQSLPLDLQAMISVDKGGPLSVLTWPSTITTNIFWWWPIFSCEFKLSRMLINSL